MSQDVSPKQALFLWRMLTGQTPEVCEPMQSKTTPKLTVEERQVLVDRGYISEQGRGKGGGQPVHLVLTDKAWAWAERNHGVQLLQSNSNVGAAALQGLLSYLLPFLHERELPLASLFAGRSFRETLQVSAPQQGLQGGKKRKPAARKAGAESKTTTAEPKTKAGRNTRVGPKTTTTQEDVTGAPVTTVLERAEAACLSLSGGRRKQRVRLSALRAALPDVPRAVLDQTLLDLQDAGRAVLYRDDNSAALSDADHAAALVVGDAPRHIIYLEA